ncbi:restriction endonuclease subunit S [Aliarcobacter cryaerophilus]|uniref:restriction endonuclease subunit S n=1 Tax=Aliarcobacter cryaerophilus TaxID=28198 RepID=UPI0013FE0B0C|nr:restriction endonuclease subunit S [Aliarcobacter cryaerophilus]
MLCTTHNSPIFIKEKFWNIDTAFGIEANRNFLIPIFLFYFTKYFNFLDLNKSTTLPSLAKTHLLQINMVVPPLKTQQKVVSYLDEISNKMEKIKQIQKEKMQSLKELKASILDQAFKGEL